MKNSEHFQPLAELLRELPAAPNSEHALLCEALNSTPVAEEIAGQLRPEHFTLPLYQRVFRAVRELVRREERCDLFTVLDALQPVTSEERACLLDALSEIGKYGGSVSVVPWHIERLREIHAFRRLDERALAIRDLVREPGANLAAVFDQAEQWVWAERPQEGNARVVTARVSALAALEWLHMETDSFGIPAGLADLDRLTLGWQATDLIVVAGRPSIGKTSFLLHCLDAAATAQVPCKVFSLEMPERQLMLRWIARDSGINLFDLRARRVPDSRTQDLGRATGRIGDLPVEIDDRGELDISAIRSEARRWRRKHPGKAVIFIDYLQRMPWPAGMQVENVAIETNAKQCKNMAKELDCPVVLLSQFNRGSERREQKRPTMAELRGSGGIEQEADVILILYRKQLASTGEAAEVDQAEQRWPQETEIIIPKHRNGPADVVVRVWFDARTGQWMDMVRQEAPPERWS